VDEVIARCVEYDMRRRYQNAADVWAALESPWPTMAARGRRPAVVAVGVAAAATVIAAAVTLGSRWLPASAPPADALKWYDDAQQALAEGASVRALKGIQQAIDLAPAVPLFHATLSEIDLELDMPARAQEAMLRADTLAAASRRLATADAAYIRGIQQLLLRNCDSAIEALKTAAANSGERQPYRLISASRAMERCNRPDEAMTTLADAARLDPRNAAVPLRTARVTANRRNYPRALASLDAAETLFRDRNNVEGVGEVLALRGTFEAEQDQLDRAGSTLAKAADIATSLDDVRQRIRVLVQQGIVQRKRGDVAAAEQLTAAATTLARNNNLETLTLEGLFSSGNVHLARNQFREAESLFERARSIAEAQQHDEYRARAQLSLASVFVQTMRPDLAAESIKAARPYYERIKQTRILASADILTGQVLMMQANYPAAIALFESEINRAKQSADSEQEALGRQNLAGALATAGRYPDALAQYRQVLEAFRRASRPRNRILARLNVADILSRLGRFEEAEATLREMPQESPLAPELAAQAFRIAGSIAFRRGRDRDALEASRKVLALNANRSEWRTLSATLLRCSSASRLELHREADSSCRDALKITADNTGHLSMWIEARVTVAEASGSSAPFDSGATILRDLQPAIARVPETELRWRYLALLARAHPAEAEKAALTRELDALRLQWGDAPYRAWRHRPDVMRLLKGFSASNKETD
jgi:tetratricopeptide (TPR) repeat protein